jgi:hypothetical protein
MPTKEKPPAAAGAACALAGPAAPPNFRLPSIRPRAALRRYPMIICGAERRRRMGEVVSAHRD